MDRRQLLAAGTGLLAAFSARAQGTASDAEILIGQTGVLSGPLGGPVKAMLAGAQLAFTDINAHGGVAGRAIKLISLDDELKPDRAVANYEKLLSEHKVFAFFGCVGSATTAAAGPVLARSGAPLIGGYAVADSAREKVKGSAYFVRAATGREAEAVVQHLTTIGLTNIAVAYLDNAGGQEALALVTAALDRRQLKPRGAAALKGDGTTTAAAAKALAAADAQAIVMYLGGAIPAELMKAIWAEGKTPVFYGMSIVPGEVATKVLGDKARGLAIAQIVPYPWQEADPAVKEYRRLADLAQVPVGYYSFEGYLSALVLLEGLRRCGRDLTRAKLHAVMRAMKFKPTLGMEVDFTGGRVTGSNFVELVQVGKDGRFVR